MSPRGGGRYGHHHGVSGPIPDGVVMTVMNGNVSAPYNPAFNLTGPVLTFIARVKLTNYDLGWSEQIFFRYYNAAFTNLLYSFQMASHHKFAFQWRSGGNYYGPADSQDYLTFENYLGYWFALEWNVVTGGAIWYFANDSLQMPSRWSGWNQYGTTNLGSLPPDPSDGAILLGGGNRFGGILARAVILDNGATVIDADFTATGSPLAIPGNSTYTDSQGNIWTPNGDAVIVEEGFILPKTAALPTATLVLLAGTLDVSTPSPQSVTLPTATLTLSPGTLDVSTGSAQSAALPTATLTLLAGGGGGETTLDATGVAAAPVSGNGPVTWSHTIGATGNGRMLVVACAQEVGDAGVIPVPTVTFDGVEMTLSAASDQSTPPGQPGARAHIFHMLDEDLPAAGTYTVSVTYTSSGSPTRCWGRSVSMYGVVQTAPDRTTQWTGSGQTSRQESIDVVGSGGWVVDMLINADGLQAITADAGQVNIATSYSTGTDFASSTKPESESGTTTLGWTWISQIGQGQAYVLAEWAAIPVSGLVGVLGEPEAPQSVSLPTAILTISPGTIDVGGDFLIATDYGMVNDGFKVTDGVIYAGSLTHLHCDTSEPFTAGHQDKPVIVKKEAWIADATASPNSYTLASPGGHFDTWIMPGMQILAANAGTGVDNGGTLITTVAERVSATEITMAQPAAGAVYAIGAYITGFFGTEIASIVGPDEVVLYDAAPFAFSGATVAGGTDNLETANDLVATAISESKEIYLPAGKYYWQPATSRRLFRDSTENINCDIVIRGQNRATTEIITGAPTPNDGGGVYGVLQTGVNATHHLRDVTVSFICDTYRTEGINSIVQVIRGGTDDMATRMTNLDVDQANPPCHCANVASAMGDADTYQYVENCILYGWGGPFGHFSNPGGISNSEFWMNDSYVQMTTPHGSIPNDGGWHPHIFYVHPQIGVNFNNVTFGPHLNAGSPGEMDCWDWHGHSSSYFGDAPFFEMTNCTFESTIGRGINAERGCKEILLDGCKFNGLAGQFFGCGVSVIDCDLSEASSGFHFETSGITGLTYIIDGVVNIDHQPEEGEPGSLGYTGGVDGHIFVLYPGTTRPSLSVSNLNMPGGITWGLAGPVSSLMVDNMEKSFTVFGEGWGLGYPMDNHDHCELHNVTMTGGTNTNYPPNVVGTATPRCLVHVEGFDASGYTSGYIMVDTQASGSNNSLREYDNNNYGSNDGYHTAGRTGRQTGIPIANFPVSS